MSFSPASILYDEYGHSIGSVIDGYSYRLKVESKPSPGSGSFYASDPSLIFLQKLTNISSSSLLVNGSVTPVEFKLNSNLNYDLLISEIRFVFVTDSFLIDGYSFGPINQLSNGIVLEVQKNDVVTELFTIKQNEDFLSMYSPGGTNIKVTTIKDYVVAGLYFGGALTIGKNSTDYICARVRDNLTDLQMRYLTVTVHGVKQ